MQYCKVCVLPSTRPNIRFDSEGNCNCARLEDKAKIDWSARERQFQTIVRAAKARNARYDCIIPVSGGKDSTWQIVQCLEYGLHPLAVTWCPPSRTDIGKKNLENLIQLGVDHIDFRINPIVEKKFLYRSFVKFGSTAVPMHMALFNIPLTLALLFQIPLIVFGENSAYEYGGTEAVRDTHRINAEWLKKYGVTHGTTAEDWIAPDLTRQDLTPYFGPSPEELEKAGIEAIFLGHFFPWDPQTTLRVAKEHGFSERKEGPKTGYYNFADIDDDFISIHHYLKWYKFGFTRLFDNLSLEIRHGRLSREAALKILKETGEQFPREDIQRFCQFLEITPEHFFDIMERFRNHAIWKKREGRWELENFLIPDWSWH